MGTTRVCGLPCASASARDSTPRCPPQLTSVHLSEPGMCRSLLPLQGSTARLSPSVSERPCELPTRSLGGVLRVAVGPFPMQRA